jgi:DNA-directed RNA polymerase specialized sigma24 family protein
MCTFWAVTNGLLMPANSSEYGSKEGADQPFTVFLTFLCPDDPDEATRRYLRLERKLEGYFRLRGMIDPVRDAEDTLDRAAQKIAAGVSVPEVDKFCIGIARNVVLERLRQRKREQSAFLEFLDSNQNNNTEAVVERITKLMRPCFDRLPQEDRDVLHSYCKVPEGISQAEHRRQLAKKLKSTIEALRIRVTRLRRKLEECVKALSKKL